MDKKTVYINVYKENDENNIIKEYAFSLENKIIDVKNKILKELFNNEYNGLDIKNITNREYKDFGKLSFNIGFLPNTIDNYKLSEFTIENRKFSFIVIPKNIEIVKKNIPKKVENVLKKVINQNPDLKDKNTFVFNQDDFPILGK